MPIPLEEDITQKAHELGFDLVGFTGVEPLEREGQRLREWLERGCHGDMLYMQKSAEKRSAPRGLLPGARGIVVVGMSYHDAAGEACSHDANGRGRVARYARGRDYHKTMGKKLKALTRFITDRGGTQTQARYYVDTGPLLEKALGARAGLGFIGKNTMLIHPEYGSWILLGEIVTTLDFSDEKPPALPDCGACRLCIEACPTDALSEPFQLDARRCISYLTIENRSDIPAGLRPLLGDWIFGCDICQEVCPYNRYAKPAGAGLEDKRHSEGLRLSELLKLKDSQAFLELSRGSPLRRAKREGLVRNACVAAGNSDDRGNRAWLEGALEDPSSMVRKHAAWALDKIERKAVRG